MVWVKRNNGNYLCCAGRKTLKNGKLSKKIIFAFVEVCGVGGNEIYPSSPVVWGIFLTESVVGVHGGVSSLEEGRAEIERVFREMNISFDFETLPVGERIA